MPHQTAPILFRGALNLDDPNSVIPAGFHNDARNVIFRGNAGDMRPENIPGTRKLTNNLPAGTNQAIGGYYDAVNKQIFFPLYNSNGNHKWYVVNTKSEVITEMMGDGPVLDFDANYPIHSINMMYGDQTQGRVLYYLNSQGVPSQINIDQALSGAYGTYRKSYLQVIKEPPGIPPAVAYGDDATATIKNLNKNLFKFKQRWRFNNRVLS